MGNNGSRTGNITQQRQSLEPEQQWAHSFPRSPPRTFQHKVLPEREVNKKLRSTNNGEILNSGGTLSGRHLHQQTLSLERENKSFSIFRTSSISSNPSDDYNNEGKTPTRSFIPRTRAGGGGFHRYAAQRYENRNFHKEQMKRFGSEPDLRDPVSLLGHEDVRDKFKGKKKYKAPPPPNPSVLEKSNLNCYRWDEDPGGLSEPLIRRGRLFKTKAELKKKNSSPVIRNNRSLDHDEAGLDCRIKLDKYELKNSNSNSNLSDVETDDCTNNDRRKNDVRYNNRLSLPEMHRTNSVPEFQAELKEVMQRIKSTKPEQMETGDFNCKYEKSNRLDAKEKLKTLDHSVISKRENIRNRLKQAELETVTEKDNSFEDNFENDRGQPSGKESTPEKSSPQIVTAAAAEKKDPPSKLFYFGMNEPVVQENTIEKSNYVVDNMTVDRFAATLQPYNHTFPLANSSGSDISSELEMDESQVSSNGIALQLRPILPKKQLEIPRFSPAAAWKLLSAVESNFAPSTAASDDSPIFMEERIEKLSRPPPPQVIQAGPRSSYDKSGDSGISGDAGPAVFDDNPECVPDVGVVRTNIQLPLVLNRSQGLSWTPQQDLGDEESSTDEEVLHNHRNRIHRSATPVKFTPKPNVFSLSLPRDNHLSSYISGKTSGQTYAGLQKLKRSVSGVLGNLANKRDSLQSTSLRDQSENWFLSKSAPNSLNNGFTSLEAQNSHKPEEVGQSAVANNTQNMSRIMYLPELENLYVKKQNSQRRQDRGRNKDMIRERSRSAERSQDNFKLNAMSKSCENITSQMHSSPEPEDLQDPPNYHEAKSIKVHKPKRFTFQSTIRQIERRRLAEKLSKEAERKEKQRLSELQAMQRVEEEFQRKRAREKASIRQQLRLFSMDDTAWSSLPPNLEIKNEVPARSEPDGAVSSTTSSPTFLSIKSKQHQMSEELVSRSPRKITPASDSSEENTRKTPLTQILSEYRQPQREYKDFRGSPRYTSEFGDAHYIKQTTIHPQVTYNIPKASSAHQSDMVGCSNYRKQFAHGVKTSRSGDSTYSDDSQSNNKNTSPKMYRYKRTPVSRF